MSSPVQHVRPAAVAGRFYPDDPVALRALVQRLLDEAVPLTGSSPKAIIAPHAGYKHSGPVAASAYAAFMPERTLIKRVVLLGPSHFVRCEIIAASSAEAFETPLGQVSVDIDAVHSIESLSRVSLFDDAHQKEHSLEVQLPFLQIVLPEFKLVPLVVGDVPQEAVSQVIDMLWDGPQTRFVISSDLSHYLESNDARKMDAVTAAALERLDGESLTEHCACGVAPVRGFLLSASKHHLAGRTLDLRNSGDTGGPNQSVVGYGAFSFGASCGPAPA